MVSGSGDRGKITERSNTMRILHTSDWHLGVSSGMASRVPEQREFLAWLYGQLERLEIDALIIAGDVFDTMHPSAEAQTLYYQFLATVAETGVRDVVVIGGNHDSPSRLRELSTANNLHFTNFSAFNNWGVFMFNTKKENSSSGILNDSELLYFDEISPR